MARGGGRGEPGRGGGGIRMIKDGRIVGRAKGEELRLNDVDKGVYRVEVRIEGKSWIYSNPIWVRGKGAG